MCERSQHEYILHNSINVNYKMKLLLEVRMALTLWKDLALQCPPKARG